MLRNKDHQILKGKTMQALYSGISYAYSEASRATQPVISTLASMMPTIGHEEAAVKKSLSTCLHEMEAVSESNTRNGGAHPLWYRGLTKIKQVILYPATRRSQLSQEEGCRIPNAQEWAIWENVTSNINQQLENWSIPFRFKISTQAYEPSNHAVFLSSNNCLVSNPPNDTFLGTFVRHCDNPLMDGIAVGGSSNGCLLTIKTDMPKSGYAHELAHLVSAHPFDAIPLASLHPKVVQAMCDSITHGDELITSLSYSNHCRDMGFTDTSKHLSNSQGEWGPIDLTLAKLATDHTDDVTHAQIHGEGVDKSYEWIKQNYGVRAAEQVAASFAKSVFIHSMSAIVARTIEDKQSLLVSRVLIHTLGSLIHLGMMGPLFTSPQLAAGQICAGSGLMGKTVKALVGIIGEWAILSTFVRLMRSDKEAMLELVYATCGTAAGNLFSNIIFSFIEQCSPTEKLQQEAYLELTKTTSLYGVYAEMATSLGTEISDVDVIANAEDIHSRLPAIMQCVATIDTAIADVIENYLSLKVMTSWLWKTDEQKADAKVQASVDHLSETLNEISEEFGPSEQSHIPANIRKFHASQTVPIVEPFESAEDDPLLFIDGAAVTGIGRVQADTQQRNLQIKKQV